MSAKSKQKIGMELVTPKNNVKKKVKSYMKVCITYPIMIFLTGGVAKGSCASGYGTCCLCKNSNSARYVCVNYFLKIHTVFHSHFAMW